MANPSEDRQIDVHHLGVERVICAWLVGDVLIDPGPESCVETLLEALGDDQPRALLLTHIHFDHAGASGALVRRWPDLPVFVHEVGAPHLADPERLVRSARMLYGTDFDRLWGEVMPVPESNLRALTGGEDVHGFRVAATPGHAKHHVCFMHEASGRAYVGDMAGVRIPPSDYTLAPTPPPDIDLEAWERSLETIAAWSPTSLGITHFGAYDAVDEQLDAVRGWLRRNGPSARELDEAAWTARLRDDEIADGVDVATFEAYLQAAPPEQLHAGLRRYWAKRDQAAA